MRSSHFALHVLLEVENPKLILFLLQLEAVKAVSGGIFLFYYNTPAPGAQAREYMSASVSGTEEGPEAMALMWRLAANRKRE